MYPKINSICNELILQFDSISTERKQVLTTISEYIQRKKSEGLPIQLMYVCTHNSRRSHFGQIWSAVAAVYYGVLNVTTFSGGTVATTFNQNAIQALEEIGFQINTKESGANPVYEVYFSELITPIHCFSKVYDDNFNPSSNFAAIMTCGDAEENCPFIPGVDLRIATTYNDPKAFDGTSQAAEKYKERCLQIALETLYVFSNVQ